MNERHLIDPTPELPDDTPIEDIRFPTRLRNALAAEGLKTVGEARETADKTLLSFQDLGPDLVTHLRNTLGLPSCDGLGHDRQRASSLRRERLCPRSLPNSLEPKLLSRRDGAQDACAEDLGIWKQYPNAAFTLLRTAPAEEADDEFCLGTFELRENISLSEK